MGVSTDAILAYGFDLGEEEDQSMAERFGAQVEDGESFDFEDWVAGRSGAVYPAGHGGIDSPEYRAYAAKRDAAIAACPVEMVMHCSYDYPMYFLAIRGTESRARRGYPQAVVAGEVAPELVASARAFCEAHGIDWKEPAWHIFSMWG